jgi:hypothetical protein
MATAWPADSDLHSIWMRWPRFCMRPSRPKAHSPCMDLLAVAIAVVFFAALLLLIEGLDRV